MTAGAVAARAARRRVDGVLLLDKPVGVSSNAALQQVKRLYAAAKAGHTGTLDPLASGLLAICFGEATKFARFLLDAPKSYVATVRFGTETTTQDGEGEVCATGPVDFERAELEAALARFVGPLLQVPPAHAALKHRGRPYYEYARAGIEHERPPRRVEIGSLRLVRWTSPDATVAVNCSKGTYVRVLAQDVGRALHSAAHLAALTRTGTGGFALADAHTIAALAALEAHDRDALLLPVDRLVGGLPRVDLAPAAAARFEQGVEVDAAGMPEGTCAVFAGARLLGVAEVAAGRAHPRRVVAPPEADWRVGDRRVSA